MTDPDIVERLRNYNTCSDTDVDEAADEIKRLRQENATLTKERDEATTKVNLYKKEHDALRAERDEVRRSYCSLMEAYRGGEGRVTANKLGWGYLFEEDKPCQ
jgi:predicted nuclease with TOPRIM domain